MLNIIIGKTEFGKERKRSIRKENNHQRETNDQSRGEKQTKVDRDIDAGTPTVTAGKEIRTLRWVSHHDQPPFLARQHCVR